MIDTDIETIDITDLKRQCQKCGKEDYWTDMCIVGGRLLCNDCVQELQDSMQENKLKRYGVYGVVTQSKPYPKLSRKFVEKYHDKTNLFRGIYETVYDIVHGYFTTPFSCAKSQMLDNLKDFECYLKQIVLDNNRYSESLSPSELCHKKNAACVDVETAIDMAYKVAMLEIEEQSGINLKEIIVPF